MNRFLLGPPLSGDPPVPPADPPLPSDRISAAVDEIAWPGSGVSARAPPATTKTAIASTAVGRSRARPPCPGPGRVTRKRSRAAPGIGRSQSETDCRPAAARLATSENPAIIQATSDG
jgi:hypothetical protein